MNIEISPIVYERELNWHDAMLYCSLLTVDNKNDWRLPTIYELRDIMDIENDFATGYYWSSTENTYGNHAWNMGVSLWNKTSQKDDIYNVRAVRNI